MNGKTLQEEVDGLINTSVQDMQSGLWGYTNPIVIRAALKHVTERGEKTKAMILRRKLKNLEKQRQRLGALYLSRLAEVDDAETNSA